MKKLIITMGLAGFSAASLCQFPEVQLGFGVNPSIVGFAISDGHFSTIASLGVGWQDLDTFNNYRFVRRTTLNDMAIWTPLLGSDPERVSTNIGSTYAQWEGCLG